MVRSSYRALRLNADVYLLESDVFKHIWSLKIAPQALICASRAMSNRLPTKMNLAKRGVVLSNIFCPMYNKVEETTQHVLINYELAQKA